MPQTILGLLALVVGMIPLVSYLIDRHMYLVGKAPDQPSLWLLAVAGALFLVAGALIFHIIKL